MFDDLGLDPYEQPHDILNPQIGGGPIVPPSPYKDEEKLYKQLVGIYRTTEQHGELFMSGDIPERANGIIRKLSQKHQEFNEFIYRPTQTNRQTIYYKTDFLAILMQGLEAIAETFNFDEPTYLIYKNMPTQGANITNNNTSNSSAHASSNQTQSQHQTVTVTIEKIRQEIENNLSPEQLKEVETELREYESSPSKWASVQNLISKLLTFGSMVAPIVKLILSHYLGGNVG